jgi:DNA (cytosine-5)-methyltransferase 1
MPAPPRATVSRSVLETCFDSLVSEHLFHSQSDTSDKRRPAGPLKVAGLFAGIGGIEQGFQEFGHEAVLLCELDDAARAVLAARFPKVRRVVKDVRDVSRTDVADADLIAAGFPCQDLSQAGRTAGIGGEQSGLVDEVFRLIEDPATAPRWLLLENVPFMLQLDRGRAMQYLTQRLGQMGYRWAYRVVDSRAFGLPQRRNRVILLASRDEDPRPVLFEEDTEPVEHVADADSVYGFYWTEGRRGLGWAVDAVPTLKGGSGLGIASPPAIWFPGDELPLRTPDLRDAERLQGFDAEWTAPADELGRRGARWKLIGNAVSVPVAGWVGARLAQDRGRWDDGELREQPVCRPWPLAAWGEDQEAYAVRVSAWPRRDKFQRLGNFLEYETAPLSFRAARGFRDRARHEDTRLNFTDGFIEAVEQHVEAMSPAALATA